MSERVWSPIANRMVPKADRAAVAAYEASPLFPIGQWLAFEADWKARNEEIAAGIL